MNTRRFLFLSLLTILPVLASAQDWMRVHKTYSKQPWSIPMKIDSASCYTFDSKKMYGQFVNKNGEEIEIPYTTSEVDSIDFVSSLTDEEKGHNKYRTFAMYIDTQDQVGITEKETWVNCHISVDGRGEFSNYSGTGRIRGRGNSSWEWYDKKPYKFKLDERSKILGMEKAKDWNLMANYRDVTDMMNTVAFETARYMGMPNTNHCRYVEVFLNGEYIGVYQLTEKCEVDDNRVNIDRTDGVMLSFDLDDGPSLSPNETNNFWSTVYQLPMSVKYPDDPTSDQLAQIKSDFAQLETAISARDYDLVDSLLDIPSFISILQLHEYLYNVEIDAPRSIYMYRDKGGKYTFGPVWDWDAGFDFDWGDMYTGHRFFSDYRELIYGTDPYNNKGASYRVNEFFTNMFGNSSFVTRYKEQWNSVKDSLYLKPWSEVEKYVAALNEGGYDRDIAKWPLSGYTVSTEVNKMSTWLQNRLSYLNDIVPSYPAGNDKKASTTVVVEGTITMNVSMNYYGGYSQDGTIDISTSDIAKSLGSDALNDLTLEALNADGTVGSNTAAGTYGAWFGEDGGVSAYSVGHVYIESNNMFSWNFGLHPNNCEMGDTHTVTMQYRYDDGSEIKALNVKVVFTIGTSTSVENGGSTTGGGSSTGDEEETGTKILGTITKDVTLTFSDGYHQDGTIDVSESDLAQYFSSTELADLDLVPLNSDGTDGNNTAAGTYGAWFDTNGDTNPWASGHVYIQSDDLNSWSYGCHPTNCAAGDTHTVTM